MKITHKYEPSRLLHTFEVIDGKHILARALILDHVEAIEDVWVSPSHRRRKIATKLYYHIEKELNIKLKPAKEQTKSGKSFWTNRQRSKFSD